MCSVRVPWEGAGSDDDDDGADASRRGAVNTGHSTAGLHFVDYPAANDLAYPANGTAKGLDFWVGYFEAAHGDLTTFDGWMHSKIQLYASNLTDFYAPMKASGVAAFERTSSDADGETVAHIGVSLAGRIVEFVGPATSLGDWDAPRWSRDECPEAHSLVSSMKDLDDAGGAAIDDATAFGGTQGLALVGVGALAAAPTGAAARELYESLRAATAADVTQLASAHCGVVQVAWPSMPHYAVRYVRNAAAATGEYGAADFDAYVERTHRAFLAGRGGASWDRLLDQHLGMWYSGGGDAANALAARIKKDLGAAGVPFAERQQADARLLYVAFSTGALAIEYQFANGASDAPSECACVADNNDATFEAQTGDACWALGDDWCA
jgi:hypothetical protein